MLICVLATLYYLTSSLRTVCEHVWLYSIMLFLFFFKQKTAYELRISDWSADVCSSDLPLARPAVILQAQHFPYLAHRQSLRGHRSSPCSKTGRNLARSDRRKPHPDTLQQGGRLPSERVVAFNRNRWSPCVG